MSQHVLMLTRKGTAHLVAVQTAVLDAVHTAVLDASLPLVIIQVVDIIVVVKWHLLLLRQVLNGQLCAHKKSLSLPNAQEYAGQWQC